MALETYRAKRNFKRTQEPTGKSLRGASSRRYVIQKHAASHLHYDFRLELDGVLLSWAVPKGPSLDPADKRLAMQVEDHPVEYGDFEGSIPRGEYGGGTVMLWDEGTWSTDGDPGAAYAKGHLKFSLQGERLRGRWSLVRTSGGKFGGRSGQRAWLLIKANDAAARKGGGAIVDEAMESVRTGRTMSAIAAHGEHGWHSKRSAAHNVAAGAVPAPKAVKVRVAKAPVGRRLGTAAALPARLRPMLATLVSSVPTGDDWVHEIKYDGYRMLARIANGKCKMYSRSGKDWTTAFGRVARDLVRANLRTAWIDGEVVVVDQHGRSRFQMLQSALAAPADASFMFFAFDLPYADGRDLREVPLTGRKALLRAAIGTGKGCVRVGLEVAGNGADFFRQSCSLGLEGAISKRLESVYADGVRSRQWVKVKCVRRQEMVIGGFTPPQGMRREFGALLLGVYDETGLRYAGKVGTGFDNVALQRIGKLLRARERATSPFIDPPHGNDARGARWVRPDLVAEVTFTEWSAGGALRHPAFKGLRADKDAKLVVREIAEESTPVTPRVSSKGGARAGAAAPRPSPIVAGISITHADKAYFPEVKVTKLALAQYYDDIAPALLPYIAGRPLSLLRCPDGWRGACFYQKNVADHMDDAVPRIAVTTSSGPATYMGAKSAKALVSLVQWGVIELHPWGSRAPRLDSCDTLIFDFDPDERVAWAALVEGVQVLRALLEEFKLMGFLKTTGGKGLHVVVPIRPALPWPRAKAFAKAVAAVLARTFPSRFTTTLAKDKRKGRIFIDYLRNGKGATAVGPYSVRARKNAPVATPIAWDELRADVRFDHFNIHNIRDRVRKGPDPWAGYFDTRQAITCAMAKKLGLAWSR